MKKKMESGETKDYSEAEKQVEEDWAGKGHNYKFQATQSAGNTFYYRDAALAFERAGDQDRAKENWEKFTERSSNRIYNTCRDVVRGFESLGDKSKVDLYKKIMELIDKSEIKKVEKEE